MNNEGVNKKITIMYDYKNPNAHEKSTCTSWRRNSEILLADEVFNEELFRIRFQGDYTKYYRYCRTSEYLDTLPEEFFIKRNISREDVKSEMSKLEASLENTARMARKQGRKNQWGNPSFEDSWEIDNCSEVLSARKAILNGAKFDKLAYKNINLVDGEESDSCKNCQLTFKDSIVIGGN